MIHKRQSAGRRRITLLDRFDVAFLSGLLAFLSGVTIWALMFITAWLVLSFELVLWFAVLMSVLGFLMAESLLVAIFEKVWWLIYGLVGRKEPP